MYMYVFLKLKDMYSHLLNMCMSFNLEIVFICQIIIFLCVYMSFNIKRHIRTSIIS